MSFVTQPLPKWVMHRYSKLWASFGEKEFHRKDAFSRLNNDGMTNVILSNLKKACWLEVKLDPDDGRKRLYRLKNPDIAVIEISKEEEK